MDRAREVGRGGIPALPSAFFAGFATRALEEARFAVRPELRYVSTERAPHYRRILRCFLEAYEGYYQDELTAEWVLQALNPWDPEYTLDRCRDDLDALCEWGNLAKSLDVSDSRLTLANLASPTAMYRATREALEIEKFLDELGRRVESEGALRHEDLLLLAQSFERLDALLDVARPSAEQRRELAAVWRQTDELFERIKREARRFVTTLREAARTSSPDVSSYVVYRDAVTVYVEAFEHDLDRVTRQVRGHFQAWSERGAEARLVEAIAEQLAGPLLTPRPEDERRAAAQNQVNRFKHWFASRSNAESFSRAARDAVYTVILRAKLLIAMARLHGSYLADLDELARLLLNLPSAEAAAKVVGVAFQLGQVPALPRSLAEVDDDWLDPWESPEPAVSVALSDLTRRQAPTPYVARPIVRDDAERAERIRVLRDERRAEDERYARLFDFEGDRAIEAIPLAEAGDCERLLHVYRGCREDLRGAHELPDGSLVTLSSPTSSHRPERDLIGFGGFGHLHWVPRARFHRSAAGGEAPDLGKVRVGSAAEAGGDPDLGKVRVGTQGGGE